MPALIDFFRKPPPPPTSLTVAVEGRVVSIALKRNTASRRLTLRMARDGVSAVMTLPTRVSRTEAQAFAEKSAGWIAVQLAGQPQRICISHGARIDLRGARHTIALTGKSRGLVLHDVSTRTLHVPGLAAHAPHRLIDWLKQEAQRDLTEASSRYAKAMGVSFTSLAVRDQKSRWGSCTADGRLSYSWRLVLAPPYVLDYVAAHEVAHLKEMNHGSRFWRLVLSHCKDTRLAKDWLKQHGKSLHQLDTSAQPS
jgi:predicted metal-dependent hydrolase